MDQERDEKLDVTKGVLVAFMVIYHAMNYLGLGVVPHTYLSFVPTSFIMISGFLIAQVYAGKYRLQSKSAVSRMALRSLKLLLIFTVLNVASHPLRGDDNSGLCSGLTFILDSWIDIYVVGTGKAAFEILLPISYLILASIPIVAVYKNSPACARGALIVTVVTSLVINHIGYSYYNAYMLTAGLIGLGLGFTPIGSLDHVSRAWLTIIALCSLYGISRIVLGDIFLNQIAGTIISVILIYSVAVACEARGLLSKRVALLGRYSLLAYIMQIFYLQVGMRALNVLGIADPSTVIVVIIVLAATWSSLEAVESARLKCDGVDKIYRAVLS